MAEPRPIVIRRVTAADAAAFARLMADPAVQPSLMQLPYTNEAAWRKRLDEPPAPGQPDIRLLAERPDDSGQRVMVGQAGFNAAGLALRRRHAVIMGIGVAPSAQGQGVGTALMQALCDYADQWAAILRVELTVFADNAGAIRLYERHGFKREGYHRGYALRAGRYEDVLTMARWHPSPPGLVDHAAA